MNAVLTAMTGLLHQRPLIFVHMLAAVTALLLGAWILSRRKGTSEHRAFGRTWALAMGLATVTSAFILDKGLPNIHGFTPIHALTVLVAVQLPRGIWHIRQGNVAAHRKTMKSIYIGGCIIAGFFTLMPSRFLGDLLWHKIL